MSLDSLLATLAATQQQIVKALQDEYFCDDVEPPPEAFGWDLERLQAFMEAGGEHIDTSQPGGGRAQPPPPARRATPCGYDAARGRDR